MMIRTTTWEADASVEVTLEVASPFSGPSVELSLFRDDGETAIGDPIPLAQVGSDPRWSTVVPCAELDLTRGEKILLSFRFDDGPENCRTFRRLVTVV